MCIAAAVLSIPTQSFSSQGVRQGEKGRADDIEPDQAPGCCQVSKPISRAVRRSVEENLQGQTSDLKFFAVSDLGVLERLS